MPSEKSAANLHISDTASTCSVDLCNFIVSKSKEAIAKNGFFRIGLSGIFLLYFFALFQVLSGVNMLQQVEV